MAEHDQRFEQMLQELFPEFLTLFFPEHVCRLLLCECVEAYLCDFRTIAATGVSVAPSGLGLRLLPGVDTPGY
jgi:hypothetical protein